MGRFCWRSQADSPLLRLSCGRALRLSRHVQRGLVIGVVGFAGFFVVERLAAGFFAFALEALARALDLAVGVVADGDSTPDETREECFVR